MWLILLVEIQTQMIKKDIKRLMNNQLNNQLNYSSNQTMNSSILLLLFLSYNITKNKLFNYSNLTW